LLNGCAATIPEIIDACKQSAAFLLEEFRKKVTNEYYVADQRSWRWINSGFYRWVVAGLPEVSTSYLL